MKISILSTLLLAAAANAQIDDERLEMCTGCLEDIDDARDCLRECNAEDYTNNDGEEVSKLAECLTEDGDFGNPNTLGQLSDCCGFDRGCENDLFDVQECLVECIDICIKDDAQAYLDCVSRETGSSGCELTACLDGFLSDDVEDEIALAGSSDIFDLRNIADTVSGIEEDDVYDCELMRDFVETACDLGRSCCDRCDSELGAVVGCLVNDIVIPFVAIEANTTIDSCPIDETRCRLNAPNTVTRKTNELSAEEAELFNKAVNLPRGTKSDGQTNVNGRKAGMIAALGDRGLEKQSAEEQVAGCEEKMRMDIIATNVTHASNKYMECITLSALKALEDAPEESDDDEGSAAPAAAKFVALAFAFVAALLF